MCGWDHSDTFLPSPTPFCNPCDAAFEQMFVKIHIMVYLHDNCSVSLHINYHIFLTIRKVEIMEGDL